LAQGQLLRAHFAVAPTQLSSDPTLLAPPSSNFEMAMLLARNAMRSAPKRNVGVQRRFLNNGASASALD
jgi:hypothetical protein